MKLLDRLRYSKFRWPIQVEKIEGGLVTGYEDIPQRVELETLELNQVNNTAAIATNTFDISTNTTDVGLLDNRLNTNEAIDVSQNDRLDVLEAAPAHTHGENRTDNQTGLWNDRNWLNSNAFNICSGYAVPLSVKSMCYFSLQLDMLFRSLSAVCWVVFYLDMQYSTLPTKTYYVGSHYINHVLLYECPSIAVPSYQLISPGGSYWHDGYNINFTLRCVTSGSNIDAYLRPISLPQYENIKIQFDWRDRDYFSTQQLAIF